MTLIPIQIVFDGLPASEALEQEIRERVAWLEQFYRDIVRCRVTVSLPHRHRRSGQHFHVRIELTVPGGEPIVINRQPSLHGRLKDVESAAHHKGEEIEAEHRYARVAVREAFDAARRRLQDFAREQRGQVKTHELPLHGRVAEIHRDEGYGFIEAGERRVYFNRASVLGEKFDALDVGAEVVFAEERGEKGPQASTVRVLGRHRRAR